MEGRYTFLVFMVVTSFILFCVSAYSQGYLSGYSDGITKYELNKISEDDRWSKCKMYGEQATPYIDGLYFPDEDYYCVWVAGNNISRINDTEYHEACHALIDNDYYHFCEEYK